VNGLYLLGLIVAVGLFAYLAIALLKPEKFE
jgi:K+-transporting ATPase KdpF subunit